MARYGQRPENALKRANEFIDVGKPARALDTLQEVFRNKKWAYSWSESVLEPIMFKYLDLCVELKKSHIAKEGLFQYRNMFQLVNVGSLENVIRGYLRMAEEKTEAAQQQCSQAVVDIDDLDNLATPESILMSAVCGEDAQDRSERTILTPWVKFLWESYCQCLELLRTNAHVETLYHDIARMAFQFCLKYNRKTEFRKLCDKLRKHLEDICKLTVQTTNVSINKPETQQLNLDTRLFQLDSAIQMELWQEAYKAIEDIHGLMNMSKKQPVAKTMANYYQKLSMVFWKAGNQLFHAAALLKLFQLSREMKKNITGDELQRMACRVLLSTLAIPLPSAHPEFDRFIETDKSPLEKAQRLAILLGLQQPPTRATLLRDIVRMNVVQLASPQLKQLYGWLETEFDPLLLCERVHSVIETLNADEGNTSLQQYIPALQDVTLVRLVRQVSQVYQSIEFARLLQLAKFTTDFHLERLLVDCVRHNDMQIRIDHAKRSIHFGMDLSESQREDRPEGPTLQSMPSEQVRNQLVNMATTLHQAITAINPNRKKTEREKLRTQLVQHYHENKVKEHQRILLRHKIIEDRKEYIERLNTVREEEEQRRQEEVQRLQQLAEQRRLELERDEREKKRQANERQQIKDRNLKEKVQKILQTSHGQRVLKKLDEEEMKKMDAEQIAAKEAEELFKERRELQAKLKSQEKKVDYFERAKRIEEIPLIQKSLEEKQVQDKKFWEQQETTRIAQAVAERAQAVAQQARLARIITEKQEFLDILKAERRHVYEDKLKVFNIMLEEERSRRLAERVKQRREERRQKWLREKEEEAHRAEEAIRRAREEELRLEQEKKAQEEKERLEMVERSAAKQRARDEELEKRERERGAERERERDRDRDRADKDKEGSRTWRSGPWTERDGERDTKTQDSWRSQNPTTPAPSAAAPSAAAPVPAVAAASIPAAADGAKEAPTPWRSKIRTEPAKSAASEIKDGARPWKPAEKGADLRTRDTDGERVPEKREVSDRHENEDRSQFDRRDGDDRRFTSRLPPRDRDDHFNNRDREKPRDREERGGFERRPERRDGDHFDRQPAREERGGERRFDDRRRDDRGGGFNRSENNEDSREQPERRDWRMAKRGEPEDDRPRRVPISRDRGPPPARGPPRGDREREPRDREPREEGGDWRNAAKGAEPPQREWRTTRPEKSAPPREATREAPAPSDGDEWHRVKKR